MDSFNQNHIINWFPGHMAKAERILKENLSMVDCVIELCDARIPESSRNPEIDKITGNKHRVLVFNKSDLADSTVSERWKAYFKKNEIPCIFTDCRKGEGVREVINAIRDTMSEKIQNQAEKGRKLANVRAMVVGIPNIGKSSFINRAAGRAVAVTGDKPGVTRAKQWLRISDGVSILDTPGLLWPKLENQEAAYKLACTGAIKDDIFDNGDIAVFLINYLRNHYPEELKARYKIEFDDETPAYVILENCGKNRGCIVKGGEVDYTRISALMLDEFRGGKIGRISMDDVQND